MLHPLLAGHRQLSLYLLAWLPVGALLLALLALSSGLGWWSALLLALPLTAVAAFAGLGAYYVCRAHPLGRSSPLQIGTTHAAAAALQAALWLGLARALAQGLDRAGLLPGAPALLAPALPLVFAVGLLLALLSAALQYLLIAFEDVRRSERRALEAVVASREAELRALRAQIHPHFLFNSLNSIGALVRSDPAGARRLTVLLADFLRHSLAFGNRDEVSVDEEVALALDLLKVEQVRFGSRLRPEVRVSDEARTCRIPPLLLQPLVENAVTHGIGQTLDGGAVMIEARVDGGRLTIAVENPRDADAVPRKGAGIGLSNVRRRLETLHGREAVLRVVEAAESFRVELELPAVTRPHSLPSRSQ